MSVCFVVESFAEKNENYDPLVGENFTDMTFHMTLKRRSEFYVRLLLLPLILLSVISPVIFWIPPSRPDRTNMGKTHNKREGDMRRNTTDILEKYG